MLHHGSMVKVADFGIAKVMSPQATMTGVVMGTPSYMSPEQIQAQAVDGRADQFSLAVLAFELLTGKRPFQGDSLPTLTHTIVFGERPSAHAANPALFEGVDDVLRRGLAKLPDERYSSCAEFIAALEVAVKGPPAPPALIRPAPPPPIQESHVVAGHQVVVQDHRVVERHAVAERSLVEEPRATKPASNLALVLTVVAAALVVAAAIVAGFLYYPNIVAPADSGGIDCHDAPRAREGPVHPAPSSSGPTIHARWAIPPVQPVVQTAVPAVRG